MKRVVTVQDISCVGKCSLTVALPIISAMGVETAVIPTAVLSAHTAFDGFTFRDLTADIPTILDHWQQQNMQFQGIYTGYLGSVQQINSVIRLIEEFAGEDTFVVIDPVMGDNGRLYAGFDRDFAVEMARLCAHGDVIVPNLTEACAMLDLPYPTTYDRPFIEQLLKQLAELGCAKVVLTGVSFEPNQLGVMAYDVQEDRYFTYFQDRISCNFHGTGDVFASTLTGALARERSLEEALKMAVDFTVDSIAATLKDENANWYGVNFEQAIPSLVAKL